MYVIENLAFPQFHEAWNKLTEWLDDSEKTLDAELEIANDPDKIKMQLAQHKVSHWEWNVEAVQSDGRKASEPSTV